MTSLALLAAFLCLTGKAIAVPAKYDQRQEGDFNVRTDVEDVVFVVVPPQDLITAGMGLVAASAVDLLRKNYGSIGPERWPQRTSSKLGLSPPEKSPYKIDLEKTGTKVKKISMAGDPNRYNFHEGKNPTKAALEIHTSTQLPEKSTASEVTRDHEEPTTEKKTIEEDSKPVESETTKKVVAEKVLSKPENKVHAAIVKKPEQPFRVIGNSDPESIFRREDCGPDAYRDSNGMCVYKKVSNTSQ